MRTKRKSRAEINREKKQKYARQNNNRTTPIVKQAMTAKMKEKQKNALRKRIQRIRLASLYKQTEREGNRQRLCKLRKNVAFREQEKQRNRERMTKLRKQQEYIENERHRNIVRNRILRSRVEYLEQELLKNIARMRKLRKQASYRRREIDQNIIRNRLLRKSVTYAKTEMEKNINRNKQLRSRRQFKATEMKRNLKRMRKIRLQRIYNSAERNQNKLRMQAMRRSRKYRRQESKKDGEARRKNMQNDMMKFRENLKIHLTRCQKVDETSRIKLKFIKFRDETPSYVCSCCEGLFYPAAVTKLNEQRIQSVGGPELLTQINNFPSGYICSTCKGYAYKGTVHKLSVINGLKFRDIPKCIEELTDLEERMVAPILNFMQIRALKPYALNPQLGLKGSVVNIFIEINDMLRVLPRRFDQMQTIQIKLKRHTDHMSHYMFESVRPLKIYEALKHLISTPLYEKYAIEIDNKYKNCFERNECRPEKIEFIVDETDVNSSHEQEDDQLMEEQWNEIINKNQINNDEVLLIDNNAEVANEFGQGIHIVAPGQNKKPLPWHQIEDLDELCFPKIFAGHAFNSPKCITYTDRAKSEARRYDRRSCIPTRILFMAKKSLEISCLSNINICLRRIKRNTHENIKVKDVRNPDYINNMIKFDDGFKILKNVRSSPAFWEQKKKELLAMIRQLGKPTFFLTLSAAERYWPELLQTLMKYSQRGRTISKEEAYHLDENTMTNLIRNDPVTCARYFEHKVQKFMWLLRQNHSIFGDYVLVDSYQRVEFQQRGSPHEHMLLWLKNAPQYDDENESNNAQLINFIEKFLCCENDVTNPYITFQTHRHTHTCYKAQKNKKCRFNIPYPVMERTMILKPLEKHEKAPANYESVAELMQELSTKNIVMDYQSVLKKLNMTEAQYILSIRSTLKQKRVFLKRSSQELTINSYNKDISQLFESNIDMQFILDEYALISYVTNYISKIEGGLSKLLRQAAEDCDNSNSSIKEKFRKIANTFLNSNLMSAQEAAYHVLSLPLSKKSRKTIFINTGPINERVLMLKSNAGLGNLNEESTDVYMDDIFEKYAKRNKIFEGISLAEYAANCHFSKKAKISKDDNECDDDGMNPYKLRQQMAVIRYRRYKFDQDPENYYREKILLFLPWRNEQNEVQNVEYEAVYKKNQDIIAVNQAKFAIMSDETIDEVLDRFQKDAQRDENHNEGGGYSNNSASHCVDIYCQGGENYDARTHPKKDDNSNKIGGRYITPARVRDDELHDMMKKLNSKQKEFVMHILNCCKTSRTPFQIFLSGSAGVGKSTVINTLYQLITNYFDKLPGGDMDQMIVLLCAPSGKAAFLINGITLHTAFSLPCQQFGSNIRELSSDVANTIRQKLAKLQLIIIDEISMVASTVFGFIDTRMRQIKGVNEPFGGVSVLAVGDLNQLPPVLDKPVYQMSKKNEMAGFFAINPLWEPFQFYELTEIMRQKDDLPFINALNNLAHGKMTDEDISLIKTREVMHDTDVPATAIRLYATRANVAYYNSQKISKCANELFIADADNIFTKNTTEQMKKLIIQCLRTNQGTSDLPAKIQLKVDIKYMITNNIDVEDGLVNGACGILKLITFKENTNFPEIIWLDFQTPRVGIKARLRYRDHMTKQNISSCLTPITKLSLQLNTHTAEKYQILRKQFPVVPAEAITIHKSQGQTYDKICLDFRKRERRTQQMLYVALSRVPNLSGLYILGKLDIPESCYSMEIMSPALVELTRLRNDKQLMLSYNNLLGECTMKIAYQNIGTLKSKLTHILNDEWFLRNDLLIFSETLAKHNDNLNIPKYNIGYMSTYSPKSRGIILYVKEHLKVHKITFHQENTVDSSMEGILLEVEDIYIISGYKSPKAPKQIFESVMGRLMAEIPKGSSILVLGDFNYNIYNHKEETYNYLINYMNKYMLEPKLNPYGVTTELNTQIDVVFSNMSNIYCGIYETYFSYHKPIHTIFNPKKEIIDYKNRERPSKTSNHEDNNKILANKNDNGKVNNTNTNDSSMRPITNNDHEVEKDNYIAHMNKNALHEQYSEDVYKFALLAEKCQEINKHNSYVQHRHINLFQEIMDKTLKQRGVSNLAQDVGYVGESVRNLKRIQRYKSNIQILHTYRAVNNSIDHWICTKADGKGNIHVYDSSNSKHLNQDQIDYLNAIYRYKKKFIFHKVQNQTNDFDCGILAIYFAILLCYSQDPEEARISRVDSLRRHISKILFKRQLDTLPKNDDVTGTIVYNENNNEQISEAIYSIKKCKPIAERRQDQDVEYNFALTIDECHEVEGLMNYIHDKHVNLFHEIMNKGLNERRIHNFAQDTGYIGAFLNNLQRIQRSKSNIQILYSGAIGIDKIGHWICTKADGKGNVHIYDSLNANNLHQDQIDYLDAIYKYQKKYRFHKVQNQTNGIDCGVFAIYFATLLCYGDDPTKQNHYDVGLMRKHIAQILLQKKLIPFPK